VRGRWLAGLLLAAPAAPAWPAITLEQVLSAPFPSGLVAARDAARVAWVVDDHGVRNVWLADAPGFNARQVTRYTDAGVPIAGLKLTPDGATLVYARGTEQNEAGEVADARSPTQAPKQQVWASPATGGEPRLLGDMGCPEEGCEDIQISPDSASVVWVGRGELWLARLSGSVAAQPLAYVRGRSADPRWSPDGRQVAFVSERDGHSLIAVYSSGGEALRYLAPSVDRDTAPRWSPDGRCVAFIRRPAERKGLPLIPLRPAPWAIWVADLGGAGARELWRSGLQPDDSFPDLTAESSFLFTEGRIVFASERDGRNHLYSIPAAGGEPIRLTPGDFDVEDVAPGASGSDVLYSSNQGDVERRHLWRVAAAGGPPRPLTRGDTIEWSPVETRQGHVLCLGSTATSPATPYRVTPEGREALSGAAAQAFPSGELLVPQNVTFRSEDGLEIHGQLFVPRGHARPGPALVFMHGGPVRQMLPGFHYMEYYHNAYAMNQYLASRGFVVLAVNYRLGIMYGRAFRQPENAAWRGSSEYRDIVAAARYLGALPSVDKTRLGLWGGSYGGLLTALGLARNSDLFAAGVDFHGVHDWSTFLPRWENAAGAPDAAAAAKLAFESSPSASVDQWTSPVLLIHGDDDRNVPFSQTSELVSRLREHNVKFEELVFPDEIHEFLLWQTWVKAYAATAEFLERMLHPGQDPPRP